MNVNIVRRRQATARWWFAQMHAVAEGAPLPNKLEVKCLRPPISRSIKVNAESPGVKVVFTGNRVARSLPPEQD